MEMHKIRESDASMASVLDQGEEVGVLGDDLHWFTTLAELERMGAAADRLHIAQPTLSRMLARLERRLGLRLFDRKGRSITLNEYGRVYYEHVRRARAELDAGGQALADLSNPAHGVVRLAFGHSFGSWPVPQLISGLRRRAGRISVTLHQDASDAVVARIIDGTADLAIVSPRPGTTGLGWRRLLRQRLALAMPADHRLAGRRQVYLRDVADAEFVALHPGFGMRRIFDELCAAAEIRPRIAFEAGELDTVTGLVAEGLGLAVVPWAEAIPGAAAPHGSVTVPLADQGAVRDVGMIWSATAVPSDAVRRFREFASAWAKQWNEPGASDLDAGNVVP